MKKTFPKLSCTLTTAFLCLTLASCGSDDPVQQVVDQAKEQSTQYVKMQEDWTSSCMESELLNASMVRSYTFSGQSFSETINVFSDESCSESIGEVKMEGEFDVENSGNPPMDLDLHYTGMSVTPRNQTAVDLFNKVNFCGTNEWNLNKETTVAGENIENCFLSSIPSKKYGKVEVDDSEDSLYLSSEFSDSAEDRPTSVDTQKVYKDND